LWWGAGRRVMISHPNGRGAERRVMTSYPHGRAAGRRGAIESFINKILT
jgi:hypothetical protein